MSEPADDTPKRPARRGASCDAVLVAAGAGERLGLGVPKALVRLDEATILEWALRMLADAGLADPVVVAPAAHLDDFRPLVEPLGVSRVVAGGATRHASVRAGVAATRSDADLVAIHDAARPLMPADVMTAAIAAVEGEVVAAAPALPVADTLKRVENGRTVTVDRSGLEAVQTPQVFRAGLLRGLLQTSPDDVTDELAVVEHALDAGEVAGRIALVRGSLRGTKITHDDDLAFVRELSRSVS